MTQMSFGPVEELTHFAVICASKVDYTMEDVGLDAASPHIQGYVAFDTAQYLAAYEALGIPTLPAPFTTAVTSDIPTLILSGSFDAATPSEAVNLITLGLSNVTAVKFADGRHVQLVRAETCAAALVLAFLHDTGAEIDPACVADAVFGLEMEANEE